MIKDSLKHSYVQDWLDLLVSSVKDCNKVLKTCTSIDPVVPI